MGLPAYKLKGLNKSGNGVISNLEFLSPIQVREKHAPATGPHDIVQRWPSLAPEPAMLK